MSVRNLCVVGRFWLWVPVSCERSAIRILGWDVLEKCLGGEHMTGYCIWLRAWDRVWACGVVGPWLGPYLGLVVACGMGPWVG